MNETTNAVLNPGSDEAIAQGYTHLNNSARTLPTRAAAESACPTFDGRPS